MMVLGCTLCISIIDGYTQSTTEVTNLGGKGREGRGGGELGVESNEHHMCPREEEKHKLRGSGTGS